MNEMERSIWRSGHMTIYDPTRVSTSTALCRLVVVPRGWELLSGTDSFVFATSKLLRRLIALFMSLTHSPNFRVRLLRTKVGLPYALYPTAPTTRSSRPPSTRFPHHVPLSLFQQGHPSHAQRARRSPACYSFLAISYLSYYL